MCILNPKQIILEEDKVVYKLVNVYTVNNNTYITTFYQGDYVRCNTLYEQEATNDPDIGFHSFENIKDAIEVGESWNTHYSIIRCIIPKDSTVYKGTFETSHRRFGSYNSFSSNKIEYLTFISKVDFVINARELNLVISNTKFVTYE